MQNTKDTIEQITQSTLLIKQFLYILIATPKQYNKSTALICYRHFVNMLTGGLVYLSQEIPSTNQLSRI